MQFEPLEIKIRVISPVIAPLRKQPHPLHLDSLVISIMTAKNKHRFPTRVGDDPAFIDPYAPERGHEQGVPFAVAGNKSPIYQASVAFAENSTFTYYNWIKKSPEPEVRRLMSKRSKYPKFNPSGEGAGPERPWLESMNGVLPTEIIFECVGDQNAIKTILQDVHGLGTMRRIGLGEILDVHIMRSDKEAKTCGLIRDGQPARELPCSDWPEQKGWNAVAATTRPPYWNPRNTELCWYPPSENTVPGTAQAQRILRKKESK